MSFGNICLIVNLMCFAVVLTTGDESVRDYALGLQTIALITQIIWGFWFRQPKQVSQDESRRNS